MASALKGTQTRAHYQWVTADRRDDRLRTLHRPGLDLRLKMQENLCVLTDSFFFRTGFQSVHCLMNLRSLLENTGQLRLVFEVN